MSVRCLCDICSQQKWVVLCAGWDLVAEPVEVRFFSLAHDLKVQRLLAEGALPWWVGLQRQTHLLPSVHQAFCRGGKKKESQFHFRLKRNIITACKNTIVSSYQQSTSSSLGCGEEWERCAEARRPWQRWDNWWPAHRYCGDSSWGHTPLCSSPHLTPKAK